MSTPDNQEQLAKIMAFQSGVFDLLEKFICDDLGLINGLAGVLLNSGICMSIVRQHLAKQPPSINPIMKEIADLYERQKEASKEYLK